jgi:hypothetical protein
MFERVIAEWSCVVAGLIDSGGAEEKIDLCVTEMIKELAQIGTDEWLASGEVSDPVAAVDTIGRAAYLEVTSHGDADTQEEFNRVVTGVRELLMSRLPEIESAARSIAKREFA